MIDIACRQTLRKIWAPMTITHLIKLRISDLCEAGKRTRRLPEVATPHPSLFEQHLP
ncbi:MAG: hypothetical protein AAF724_03195 [Pseudomonadota bacterium]